jgi:hypothetical protein
MLDRMSEDVLEKISEDIFTYNVRRYIFQKRS